MHLSPIYSNMVRWILVYHTRVGSPGEVELVTEKVFKTSKKAIKWFDKHRQAKDFIRPMAVRFSGLDNLKINHTANIELSD